MFSRLSEDGVLRSLSHAELDDLLRGNLDGLASRGIAAHASLAVDLDELAEARENDALGALRALISDREELLIGSDDLLLADASGLSHSSHDLGLGSGNLLSHFFDPLIVH